MHSESCLYRNDRTEDRSQTTKGQTHAGKVRKRKTGGRRGPEGRDCGGGSTGQTGPKSLKREAKVARGRRAGDSKLCKEREEEEGRSHERSIRARTAMRSRDLAARGP